MNKLFYNISNSLIISKIGGGIRRISILLVLCVCLYACSSKPQSEEQSVPQALQVVGEKVE
ncbi:MAG: hypothetical protein II928_02830 [Paludibacteraceae bacterium]|nr:hypothetical protein [Paludibacteraceae bacterium]